MIAIIDIGSNTIRLSVYEIGANGEIRQVHKLRNVVGLAGYINEKNMLTEEGVAEACAALNSFGSALAWMDASETHVFATAALRNVANTSEIVSSIKRETGFDVTVISGEEEALCGYVGVANDIKIGDGIFIDIGGGSTELVIGKNGQIAAKTSLPVGSLTMYAKYVTNVFPTKAQREKIRAETIAALEATGIYMNGEAFPAMYGVGGTVRTLRKLHNAILDAPKNTGAATASDVKRLLGLIELNTHYMLGKITRLTPERIHTITPGLIILDTIMDAFRCQTLTISDSGVREGFLIRNVLR